MGTPEQSRGRTADKPHQIPPAGWKDIAIRVKKQLAEDHVGLISAGIAFYAMLALFPMLIALVSMYGLVADPVAVEEQAKELARLLPAAAHQLLTDQLRDIVSGSSGAMSLGFVLSLLGVLWSASAGTASLIEGVNIAYDERESRNYFRLRGLAVLMALSLIVFGIVSLGLIAVVPIVLKAIGLGSVTKILLSAARWPLLALAVMTGLAVLYRYAPNRNNAKWRWVTWGAAVATILWLLASVLFSVYVEHFGNYNKTYGTLAAVVLLMMWMYASAYVILLGAELDAEIEAQTAKDSTEGPPKPMGQRGAIKADRLGESYP